MAQKTDQQTKEEKRASRKLAQTIGKIIALVLVLLIALLIERYCTVEIPPFGPGAKIVSLDGDTIRAGNGAEYRLFGIDAPELKQACTEADGKSWLCGRAAKAKLTTFLNRGNVDCDPRAEDRFGRIVAVCRAEGVPDIGEAMVRDGYAIDLGGPAGHPYREAEAEAKAAKRGIWRGSFELPSAWRAANPQEGD
ncbi:MAG TPA: thermonuclease family protein [Methyloceanibacter sp.]|nr:thermonuclease family protein [Methyloceanibacter sp.]